MKYAFILGRETELSIAEIIQVLRAEEESFKLDSWSPQMAIFDLSDSAIFPQLGGSIKVGEVQRFSDDQALAQIEALIRAASREGKKLRFGISVYAASNEISQEDLFGWQKDIAEFAFDLKQHLKIEKVAARFVTSRQSQLSSVVVKKNGLTDEGGLEVLVGIDDDGVWIGLTHQVQDFEKFSHLDYDRPARDDVSGMLPPKLAKMILNLTGIPLDRSITVLDPHCGSGTVLQEAAMLGAGKVLGSDISAKAIEDSERNIKWLKTQENIQSEIKIEQVDANELSSWLPENFVDIIATEPYLGAPIKGALLDKEIKTRQKFLSEQYSGILKEIYKVVKPEGVVVFIFPFIKKLRIPFPDGFEKQWERIDVFKDVVEIKTARGSIDYKRPNQYVGREIMVLKKR